MFIDDDVEAPPGWLARAAGRRARRAGRATCSAGRSAPALEGGGPRTLRSRGGRRSRPWTSGPSDRDVPSSSGAPTWRSGAARCERVGAFDETLHGRGDEEDWERRYAAAGGRDPLPRRRRPGSPPRRGATPRCAALARAAYGSGPRRPRATTCASGAAPSLRGELRTLVGLPVAHRAAPLRRRARAEPRTRAGRLREALLAAVAR